MSKVSINNELVILLASVSNGTTTLKAAKAQVLNVEGIDLDSATEWQDIRTKKQFIETVGQYVIALDAPATEMEERKLAAKPVVIFDIEAGGMKELETAVMETVEVVQVEEDEVQVGDEPTAFDKLDLLAADIRSELDKAQQAFMYVGEMLIKARDLFDNQKDFLKWAVDACGIQKAQVYKLMKVYKTFGCDSIFNGVAMRVLYTLSNQADEVIAAAEELAQDNELDSRSLNKLIDDMNGKDEAEPTPTPEQVQEEVKEAMPTPSSPATPEEVQEGTDDDTPPFDVEPQATDSDAIVEAAQNNHDNEVACLLRTIDELKLELKAANERASMTVSQAKAESIAVLPQFASDCMYARLGLSFEQSTDKAAVNKAYRALAKIYTKTVAPEAAENLLEARTALLSDAK